MQVAADERGGDGNLCSLSGVKPISAKSSTSRVARGTPLASAVAAITAVLRHTSGRLRC